MDISELSNIYNDTNTRNISAKLKTVKQLYGTKLFELLLKDILDKNMPGVDQTIRLYTKELPDPLHANWDVYRDIDGRNQALRRLRDTLDDAYRYNSPELECDNCHRKRPDVWRRGNNMFLCSNCAKDIVEEVKPSPEILKAVKIGYDFGDDFVLPDDFGTFNTDDETDILI